MDVESSAIARCVKHPSQFFTGFCSSCLVERLASVDSVEKSPESEIVEVRVRRTLLSLFQLDDEFNDAQVDKKLDECVEDKHLNEKISSFKGLRWRFRGASKSGRFGDNRDSGESCDSGKGTWEKPRHSWDGLVMSKALTCSFACLEEPQDGSRKIERSQAEETVVTDSGRCDCSGSNDVDKVDNVISIDEKAPSSNGNLGSLFRERHREDSNQEMNVMDVDRKKSHRWSRVWDWSITSPFRDFSKKREHNLERSSSGTCQETRNDRSEMHRNYASRINQSLNRRVNGGIGEVQKFRPDWQRKREFRFGRSRSVHYPSPSNIDNGLLRFYLTPMRTSRRSSNNGRMRTPSLFSKDVLKSKPLYKIRHQFLIGLRSYFWSSKLVASNVGIQAPYTLQC